MNKTQFVKAMAKKSSGELTEKQSKIALESFIQVVEEAMEKFEKISITGFCTFNVAERSARDGVNPSTQEKIFIPAQKVIRIKAGTKLKEKVAKK